MIGKFLDYLRLERNASAKTIQSYSTSLAMFEDYFTQLDSHLTWESVDSDIIRDWMGSMMDKGHKATSINARLSALRSFFLFALRRGLVEKDPAHGVNGPKIPRQLPQFIREADMDRLLDEVMTGDDYRTVMERMVLMMFYSTGMRVAELTGLTDVDVDLVQRVVRITGKRNKQRIVPFGDELAEASRVYIIRRDERARQLGAGVGEVFFMTDRGKPLSISKAREIVKRNLSLVTTQGKLTPHVLRHSFATAMLNHEAGLESVRKLLGHARLNTTEIYTHTTFEQLRKTYGKAHPREGGGSENEEKCAENEKKP